MLFRRSFIEYLLLANHSTRFLSYDCEQTTVFSFVAVSLPGDKSDKTIEYGKC